MPLLTSTPQRGDVRTSLRRILVSGFAVVVPFVLTLFIISFAVNFFSGFLQPVVNFVQQSLGYSRVPVPVIEVLTAVLFLVVVFLIGVVTESDTETAPLERRFEAAISNIPGIGSIYSNLNEMSELLLEQDTESFQEVKLVEFPKEGSYVLAFLTASEPSVVEEATGTEMQTLFAPMGPNPFMGGHVIHVETEQVHEIDMSVEEGIQTIVSSGVTVNDPEGTPANAPPTGEPQ